MQRIHILALLVCAWAFSLGACQAHMLVMEGMPQDSAGHTYPGTQKTFCRYSNKLTFMVL